MTQALISADDASHVVQASSDDDLVELWLNQYRPSPDAKTNTSRAYTSDLRAFRLFNAKPLRKVTVGDLQAFSTSLLLLAPTSHGRRLNAIKSLISFGHRLGYLPFDVGAPIRVPALKDLLAERILSEEQVQRLLWHTDSPDRRGPRIRRNAAMVRLLYVTGIRISELVGISWRDLVARDEGGQLTVFGKGGKTRPILLPVSMWSRMDEVRVIGLSEPDDPVFRGMQGARLSVEQAHAIVKQAFKRAKLPSACSAHWLRHAHASHALDRGCPVHVLQTSLGHASLTTTTRYTHARPGDSSSRYLSA
jgi:integrase/recombinase XerD